MIAALEWVGARWKAVAGVLVPALVTLGYALHEASEAGSSITTSEWILVALAALGTGGVVHTVPNVDKRGKRQDESVQRPEAPPAREVPPTPQRRPTVDRLRESGHVPVKRPRQ